MHSCVLDDEELTHDKVRPMTKSRKAVFLSHSTSDKPAVEELADRLLRQEGLDPWLDKWNLIPGEPFQPAIEAALKNCVCCAVSSRG
jgi:hypothetical protein